MKGYQSFKVHPALSFERFVEIVEERWDCEANGSYVIGRPNKIAIGKELFVMLPATDLHIIIVRPRKSKITLTVSPNEEGAQETIGDAKKLIRRGSNIITLVKGTTMENNRKGPAEEALQFYTAKMTEMLVDYI
jgi:hypothetical protein